MPTNILDGLNPPQRIAAGIRDGAVLVLAGAGSGKTRLLTHRIAWLVEQGVPPWQILAVTFTNKAAGEMKERVASMLASRGHAAAADQLTVSTFHSMCARFLRRDIDALGYTRSFTIYDDDDQKRLLKDIVAAIRPVTDLKPAAIRRVIDSAKNKLWSPDDLARHERFPASDPTVEVYRRYEGALKAANAVDFNDLVNLVVRLWREHPSIANRYRGRYRYLLVDEYQDTNTAQYQLVQLLAAPNAGGHGNVMVVGDDDQSIYAFRGADIRNILDFQKDFPGAQVVRLEQNYRSTGHILNAANAVVANNRGRMEKRLWTDGGDGELVRTLTGADEADEASSVVGAIRAELREGRRYGDIAIIYRTNAASRPFEQALVGARIPHVLVGSRKFYERREVRDMVAYLKLIVNPADGMGFLRVVNVPRRGVGPKAMAEIQAIADQQGVPLLRAASHWASGGGKVKGAVRSFMALLDTLRQNIDQHSPGQMVELLLRETGYAQMLAEEEDGADRLANVQELARAIDEDLQVGVDGPSDPLMRLQDFLDRVSLAGQADELPEDDEAGRVTLLTAHLCKGLEFPVVFVTGMHEGGFPHWNAREREEELEEERRLLYVAMTRAERVLTLSRARRRMVPGTGYQDVAASRFLGEIPREHLHRSAVAPRSAPGEDAASRMSRLGFTPPAPRATRRPAMGRPAPSLPDVTSPPAAPARAAAPKGHYTSRSIEDVQQLNHGTRVLHPALGAGTVLRVEGGGNNLKLVINFDEGGRKVIYARFVELELLDG